MRFIIEITVDLDEVSVQDPEAVVVMLEETVNRMAGEGGFTPMETVCDSWDCTVKREG